MKHPGVRRTKSLFHLLHGILTVSIIEQKRRLEGIKPLEATASYALVMGNISLLAHLPGGSDTNKGKAPSKVKSFFAFA